MSDAEECNLRDAIDARNSANHWRAERGYGPLPSRWAFVFTDHVKPRILLPINAGCRRGELFDLTWSNVDLDRRILTVAGATAQSRRTRHLPLNCEATAVMPGGCAQSEDISGLVFVNDTTTVFGARGPGRPWRGVFAACDGRRGEGCASGNR